MGRYVRQPDDLLRRARLARGSVSGSGRVMSWQELAEAVNGYLFATTRRAANLDANHVGKLEQARIRWPRADDRQAFRAVGATTGSELGFYLVRRSATADDHAGRCEDMPDRGHYPAPVAGPHAPLGVGAMAVRVAAKPGTTVVVASGDADPPRAAITVGPLQVLIEPAASVAGAAGAADDLPPSVGGARIYSFKQARGRRRAWRA